MTGFNRNGSRAIRLRRGTLDISSPQGPQIQCGRSRADRCLTRSLRQRRVIRAQWSLIIALFLIDVSLLFLNHYKDGMIHYKDYLIQYRDDVISACGRQI